MYLINPPAVRDTEVFSTMPERFRRPGRQSAWADANRGGIGVDSFLEGPVCDAKGNLYVTDIPYGRVFRIDPAGGNWDLVAEYDGEANGMKFLSDGALLITDYKNGLMVLELASGRVHPFLERRNSERFKGVNDLVFYSRGNLYFTDQGQTGMHDPTGRIYRLAPDGKLDALITNAPSPNGVVLSPDEKILYVGMTRGNSVWRIPLLPDGSVSKVGQFFTSYGPSGPDGLAMDVTGRLFVANPGLGWVWVLDAHGRPVEILRGPAGSSITNVAFGGPGRRTLYMTDSSSGTVRCATMSEPGCALHRPRAS